MADTTTVIVRSDKRAFNKFHEFDPEAKPRGWMVKLSNMPVFQGDAEEKGNAMHDALVAAEIIDDRKWWVNFVHETNTTQEYSVVKRSRR